MFINFRKLVEIIFKSFDISGDTKTLEKLQEDGIRFLMIVKKQWIYGVFHSWSVFAVILITCINVYLLTFVNDNENLVSIILAILLSINVIYWVFIVISYIYKFYKVQGNYPKIEDIYSAIKQSKDADKIFGDFFNQTIFLFIILAGITIFTLTTGIYGLISEDSQVFGVGIINGLLLIVQLGLFFGYFGKMINLEMDYRIIVPGQLIFADQKGILQDSQTMKGEKIKTINTKYPGLIGSLFNYGDIVILTEGDTEKNGENKGEMRMDFIGSPNKTVKEIEKVLNNDLKAIENEVNVLLKKIGSEIGINDVNSTENLKKLNEYVKDNEIKLKDLYEKADEETKSEIKQLYVLITK